MTFLTVMVVDMTHVFVKSKTPKIYKNKKLNDASFANYNLNDYQVFLHLISMIGGVDELGKYLQPEKLQRAYTLTAEEFGKTFDLEVKHSYKIIKQAAKKLMKTSIILEKPDLFTTQEINICSMAEYNLKQGSITIEFTDRIMPYLAQVKQKFVLYNLKEISNFGSLYTTRLYELIQEFKETGYMIKSVEQLRKSFAVGQNYKLYGHFKAKTFGHAVKEINDNYEMGLKFSEIKEGKKVTAISFEFKKTFIKKVIDLKTGNERNIYIKPKRKIKIQKVADVEPEQPDLF